MSDIEVIKKLQRDISELRSNDEELTRTIEALRIDKQIYLRANESIKPGMATKVAYDENGLILSGEELDPTDIPELTIDHINGLRDALANKATRKDLKNISVDLEEIFKERDITGTGCKVNYDRYGVIQSSSDLLVDDIPKLPISHIDGLTERLELLKNSSQERVEFVHDTINAGSGCKIFFDEHGHITRSTNLDMNDIPQQLIIRLNEMESRMMDLAPSKTLESINKTLSKKVTKEGNVVPGTYTKVTVNNDGLITNAENMTVNDLPEISIVHIKDLYKTLKDKAEHSDVVELMNSVNMLMTYVGKIGEVASMKNKLDKTVSDSQFSQLSSQVSEIQKIVDRLSSIDFNVINNQLENINKSIDDLSSRITLLEQKYDF
ncbi:MAG: hypothetical protein NC131_10215 [Roseburia sp.]|nr:hypothetical protein [Roseburia sp.]